MQHFRQHLRACGYQMSTQKMVFRCTQNFLAWWQKDPQSVDKTALENYQNYLENRPNQRRAGGLSQRYIRHNLYSLRLFFNYLEQSGQQPKNPMSAFVLPSPPPAKRAILSLQQVKKLYEVCENSQDKILLHLFYGCGLRRSEGLNLALRDLDLKRGWLYVRKGKLGKRRVVPMSPRICQDLQNYCANSSQRWVLAGSQGKKMDGNFANRRLKKLLQKADLPPDFSLHSLRHSIATHLIINGLEMEQVRDFLGHRHLQATQIYLHEHTNLP